MIKVKYTKDVHAPALRNEVLAINETSLGGKFTDNISIAGNEVCIELSEELTAPEEVALNNVVAAHSKQNALIKKGVEEAIDKAMEFGKKLIIEYGAQNVIEGKTTAEVKQIAVKFAELQNLLMSGSLYAARDAMDDITPDALVTQETIDDFKAKLDAYLGN